MSSESTSQRPAHPRPSIVTLACVFVAVTAFLTLTELVVALMDWATVDMQKGLQPVLQQLAAVGAVLTMAEVLQYLRWFFLAMVPFSVAAMVFAIYALRGDRTARVMTTILAIVAGVVSLPIGVFGVLQASMLFLAAGALWTSDARRWYRGEPPPEAAAPPIAELGLLSAPAPAEAAAPVPVAAPAGERPTSVMTAALLAILGSVGAAGFATLYLVVHTFARAAYVEAVKTGPFSDLLTERELEIAMQVSFWASVVILPLALLGILGGLALLGRRGVGRTATLAWAWVTAVLGLVMLPVGLLATAGAAAVIVLLLRDDARRWTASR